MPSKRVSCWSRWAWGKDKGYKEQDQMNREAMFLSARNCRRLSTHLSRYFSYKPKSSVIIFQTLFFFISSRLVIILTDNHYTPFTLPARRWPAFWRPFAPGVTSSRSFLNNSKTRVRCMVSSPYTYWSIYETLLPEFFSTGP